MKYVIEWINRKGMKMRTDEFTDYHSARTMQMFTPYESVLLFVPEQKDLEVSGV